jgi:hypothetical protein
MEGLGPHFSWLRGGGMASFSLLGGLYQKSLFNGIQLVFKR